jgi:hypothetical protein
VGAGGAEVHAASAAEVIAAATSVTTDRIAVFAISTKPLRAL